MNLDKFWRKADDIRTIYHSKYRHAVMTDDDQLSNVSEFLSDMTALSSEWHNRDNAGKESNKQ